MLDHNTKDANPKEIFEKHGIQVTLEPRDRYGLVYLSYSEGLPERYQGAYTSKQEAREKANAFCEELFEERQRIKALEEPKETKSKKK